MMAGVPTREIWMARAQALAVASRKHASFPTTHTIPLETAADVKESSFVASRGEPGDCSAPGGIEVGAMERSCSSAVRSLPATGPATVTKPSLPRDFPLLSKMLYAR